MTIFKVPTNYGELGKLRSMPKFEHLDMEHVERNYHRLGLLWKCRRLRRADNPSKYSASQLGNSWHLLILPLLCLWHIPPSPYYFLTFDSVSGFAPCAHFSELTSPARLTLQGLLVSWQQPSCLFLERISLSRSRFSCLYNAKCRLKQLSIALSLSNGLTTVALHKLPSTIFLVFFFFTLLLLLLQAIRFISCPSTECIYVGVSVQIKWRLLELCSA